MGVASPSHMAESLTLSCVIQSGGRFHGLQGRPLNDT